MEKEKEGLTELDDVSNSAHDEETNANRLADFNELLSISYRQIYISSLAHEKLHLWRRLTLLAPVDELHAILQEVAWDIEEFLYLVCHGDRSGMC